MATCATLTLPTGWHCCEVSCGRDGPVIILLDEDHDCTAGIDESIDLTRSLVADHDIGIIGVEGYACRNDPYPGDDFHLDDSTGTLPGANCLTKNNRFAKAVLDLDIPVVGVDSEGYCYELEQPDAFSADGTANLARSELFVHQLILERTSQGCSGPAILNCGLNHGQHIMDFASARRRPSEPWPDGRFIRLRAPSLPQDRGEATQHQL